ncbi:MAG: C69 family dipeptidase [Anaerolineaceae bacterium]|nr:C69 family dipeptidase [Anaerolineaceae bacterium]
MCYMLAAGKKATADGSVLVARNCDAPSTLANQVISVPRKRHKPGEMIKIPDSFLPPTPGSLIPQAEETFAYTAIVCYEQKGGIPMNMGGINEFQVSVGASTGGWVKPEVDKISPWPKTVVGDYLMTLALERCKTAREAVRWLGDMTEKYGGRTDNYIVGDPNEVWLFEQYQGFHWAAARVPDDCFVVEANSFRLAEINPEDPDNYMCDPDLIPFAIAQGLWDPNSDVPFHASRAYGTNKLNRPRGDYPQPYYSLRRIWRGVSLLNKNLDLDPYEPTEEYPLFVKPDHKLTPADMIMVLSDFYQGTQFDEYGAQEDDFPTMCDPKSGRYRLAPAWNASRNIGCPQTVTSWVTQSRDWLPNEIGGVIYSGLGPAINVPHLPWYAHNSQTPQSFQTGDAHPGSGYMEGSAYWAFMNVCNMVNFFYDGTKDLVQPVWFAYDKETYELQKEIEEKAIALYKKNPQEAVAFLTEYSNQRAEKAYQMAIKMQHDLFTRLAMLNNPQTSRVFSDPKTWTVGEY